MTTSEKEYDEKYGHIPSQKDEIIKFMEENLNINMEKVLREEERAIVGRLLRYICNNAPCVI